MIAKTPERGSIRDDAGECASHAARRFDTIGEERSNNDVCANRAGRRRSRGDERLKKVACVIQPTGESGDHVPVRRNRFVSRIRPVGDAEDTIAPRTQREARPPMGRGCEHFPSAQLVRRCGLSEDCNHPIRKRRKILPSAADTRQRRKRRVFGETLGQVADNETATALHPGVRFQLVSPSFHHADSELDRMSTLN